MKRWFDMKAENGVGVINIFGDIGGWGISFREFNAALENLGTVSEIRMMVNSDGGDVFDGFAIYNALSLHPARKVITVMGLAASMASVITMAADRRVMPENSLLMIHNPQGGIVGTAEEIESYGRTVGQLRDKIAGVYARASGGKLSTKKALAMMDAQTWIMAEEAVALGLADEMIAPVEITAKLEFKTLDTSTAPAAARATLDLLKGNVVNEPISVLEPCIEKESTMTDTTKKPEAAKPETPAVDEATVLKAERNRVKQIGALCRMAGRADAAEKMIEDGLTLDAAVDALAKLGPVENKGDEVTARHNVETGVAPVVIDAVAIWNRYNKVRAA